MSENEKKPASAPSKVTEVIHKCQCECVCPPVEPPPRILKKIQVQHLQVRECASAIAMNTRMSLQDNLNDTVERKLNEVPNLHRVVSVNYSESEGLVRKNCALATVWFETVKYELQKREKKSDE